MILLEPEVEYRGGPEPFRFRKDWDRQKIKNLTDAIILACVPGHACCIIQEEGETSASAQLKMQKYLQLNMAHPSFMEAFSSVLKTAGMSQGVSIRTEGRFE